MAVNPLYIPLFNIEEVILDKDSGLPLAAGVVKFYRDSQRLTPKVVFQIAGTSPNYSFISLGAELTLGLSGTFVDQDGDPMVPYAYPYDTEGELDLYYVTVESEGGIPQFVRQAVPYVDTGGVSPAERSSTSNELSNPQFVQVNIPSNAISTITVSGSNTVTPVAPGWEIVSSGSGTLILEQLQPTSANVVTNPPFALRIQASSGLGASVVLRQRLFNSPSIFRGGFASGSITAAVISGGGSFITMTYAPSSGTPTEIIPSTSIPTDGAYHVIANNAAIPDQGNPAAGTGYTDINITLPTSRNIAITSIQVVGTAIAVNIPFDQQTADRQKDHLFHYYLNGAVHQPKSDLLTGWNFALNPWQFRTTAKTNVAVNQYTADQTIVIQQPYVNAASGNNIAVGKGISFVNFGFGVEAVTTTNQFGILQYIDPQTIRPYWTEALSSLVNAFTNSSNPIQIKMRLIYMTGLPSTTSQTYPVASWTQFGDPVFAAGITALTPTNDPIYTLTSVPTDFAFEGFSLPISPVNGTLAIFFYTYSSTSQNMAIGDHLIINDISLVHNSFAVRTSPKSFDEVLRQCQFYYEKSYDPATLPGTNTASGMQYAVCPLGGDYSSTELYKNTFQISYKSEKRAVSTITFYAPDGTLGDLNMGVWNGVAFPAPTAGANPKNVTASVWSTICDSTSNRIMRPNDAGAVMGFASVPASMQGVILYHYTADSRLGI